MGDDTNSCPVCKVEHAYIRERENRIEALRAASWVVAGMASGHWRPTTGGGPGDVTVDLAEQFARWLEGDGQ